MSPNGTATTEKLGLGVPSKPVCFSEHQTASEEGYEKRGNGACYVEQLCDSFDIFGGCSAWGGGGPGQRGGP